VYNDLTQITRKLQLFDIFVGAPEV
jgi:hypothetical protein